MTTYLTATTYKSETDPLKGLVEYFLAVKPYHTKIYEIIMDYTCSDEGAGTALESWETSIQLRTPDTCSTAAISVRVKSQTTYVATLVGEWLQYQAGDTIVFRVYDEDDVLGVSVSAVITDITYDGTYTIITVDQEIPSGYEVVVERPYATVMNCPGGFGYDWDALDDTAKTNTRFEITKFGASSVTIKQSASQLGSYSLATINTTSNMFMLCQTVQVILIDVDNRTISLVGDQTSYVYDGGNVVLMGATTGNGAFTVASYRYNGAYTIVVLNEPLPITASAVDATICAIPLAVRTGTTVDISNVPQFSSGEKVTISGFSSVGVDDGTYYVFTNQIYGIISLSTTRLEETSVDVTAISSSVGTITRTELLSVGSAITIDDTLRHTNDGDFVVLDISNDGNEEYTLTLDNQLVNPDLSVSGRVILTSVEALAGYDPGSAWGCLPSCTSDLTAYGRVGERITIDIDIEEVDNTSATASEIQNEGWDDPEWDGPNGWDGAIIGFTLTDDSE